MTTDNRQWAMGVGKFSYRDMRWEGYGTLVEAGGARSLKVINSSALTQPTIRIYVC